MGHDITGYKNSAPNEEVAYLRRGAFNDLKNTIYNALDANDCNCGVSGCGMDKVFTQSQLRIALDKIPKSEEYLPERKFLNDCINQNDNIKVYFS